MKKGIITKEELLGMVKVVICACVYPLDLELCERGNTRYKSEERFV